VTTTAPTRATRFTVNGRPVEVAGPGGQRLLDALRIDLGLTGTKEGCGEGECGACTVLVDEMPVLSCLLPVGQVDGREIRTVEGLSDDGRLDPVQAAFVDSGGVQCGICTPGILMSARAFLDSGAEPTEAAIREVIAGNLCRCTGYMKVIDAIAKAATIAPREVPGGLPEVPRELPGPTLRPGVEPGSDVRSGPPFVRPTTLAEAYALLAEGTWRPIAGGTDIMVELAGGTADPRGLLDLTAIDELRGIRVERGRLVIGATATYRDIRRSPLVASHLPAVVELAAVFGATQLQNMGTLGGNVVTASPAGDSLPLMLAAEAVFVAGGPDGEREIPAASYFAGYRKTALRPGELLLRIELPIGEGRHLRYRKIGTRRALALSKVALAVAWREEPGSPAWRDVRVAVGTITEVPIRAPSAEAVLEGAVPSAEVAERAAAAVLEDIHPRDGLRSTAAYRRSATARVLRRIVEDAAG
jgi:carbon-monoxide dehydrogenase small subunit/xanthine dehydrogenase small subunit